VRVVQRQAGNFLADHAARADRRACGWRDEAKRAFDAMMEMKKIDIAAIEAAWRG
jgi:predicted 3-demethylubiquinone-9 3-methyltransferase (glyoxalase superfamily)